LSAIVSASFAEAIEETPARRREGKDSHFWRAKSYCAGIRPRRFHGQTSETGLPENFSTTAKKERKTAKDEAGKLGMESRSSGLRFELFKAQGGICLYTGKALAETHLEDYEIDHIVPRSLGGPDAAVNYVLTIP